MKERNYIFCPEKLIENYKKDGVAIIKNIFQLNLTSNFQYRPLKAEFDEHGPEINIPDEGCIFFQDKSVQYVISTVPWENLLLTEDKEKINYRTKRINVISFLISIFLKSFFFYNY